MEQVRRRDTYNTHLDYILIMHHIPRPLNFLNYRPRLAAHKVIQAGFGQEVLQQLKIILLEGFSDVGGAYGPSVPLLSGEDHTFDAGLWQLLAHQTVVDGGDMACGLLAHIPFGNVKAFGYFREYGQIKPGMAFDNLILVLQKIAGEGGVADDIRAAVMTIARGISLGTAAPTPSVRQRPWRQERSRGQ